MAKTKRIGPWTIGGLIALAIAIAIFFMLRQPAIPVDMGKVARGPMQVTIDDEAETRVHDMYVVSAPINGRLLRVNVEPGDQVIAKTTVVAQMVPAQPDFLDTRQIRVTQAEIRSLEAAAASSAARIAQAQAERTLAEANWDRRRKIYDRGFLSKAELDSAQMTRDRARAALAETQRAAEAARASLAAARASLTSPNGGQRSSGDAVMIRAPVSGWVLRVVQKSEATLGAGTSLVEIGDPAGLEIITDLLSADAVQINPGARATLEQWGSDIPIQARVRNVEPYGFTKISALGVEEQRVNVILDFVGPVEQRARLGHGYRGIVHIVTWASEDVLTVPTSALFREGNDWALFMVENGRARLTRVKIGAMNADRVELLTKLAKGTSVILHPGDRISDDVRVTARSQ